MIVRYSIQLLLFSKLEIKKFETKKTGRKLDGGVVGKVELEDLQDVVDDCKIADF